MSDRDDATPEARFRIALELYEAGELRMRQNSRRRYPDAGEAEIDEYLRAWLRERPSIESGALREVPWPPRERRR
jgi:hypothetical protein